MCRTTQLIIALGVLTFDCWAFVPKISTSKNNVMPMTAFQRSTTKNTLNVHRIRDADFLEQFVGGERYSVTPLPDPMMETTIFVGNLNEFVTDDDLSRLFGSMSSSFTSAPPASVARKPSTQSLHYGFVAFCTPEEAEMAILRFHGTMMQGQPIKVEPIRDHPGQGRVKVPEKLVTYVMGECKLASKKSKGPQPKTQAKVPKKTSSKTNSNSNSKTSRKNKPKQNKKKFQLDSQERQALDRATKYGFITTTDSSSAVRRAHARACSKRKLPQIMHVKARSRHSGASVSPDIVWIDLSTTRKKERPDFLDELYSVADSSGMLLQAALDEDGKDDHTRALEGDRSMCKAFCKEMASLWGLPQEIERPRDFQRKRRGGGHHQRQTTLLFLE